MPISKERQRLQERGTGDVPRWRKWGPYVAERSWATVREDYSQDGNPWTYLPHELARSKAFRWGEDGIAGFCDRYQIIVFAPAFWNGRDPILKERLFGLGGNEGNHGEDVKEHYFYLDGLPTHAYMKYLYKYPQGEFPYRRLVEENARRSASVGEFELLDTGIFDDSRYFDIFIEYAKLDPEDICIRIEAINRGPEEAVLHLLPQLWFRNTWAWSRNTIRQPSIRCGPVCDEYISLTADDAGTAALDNLPFKYSLGTRYLYADAGAAPLFTFNETNPKRVPASRAPAPGPYFKDAFHDYIVGREPAVNPEMVGTKACLHYAGIPIAAGRSHILRLRLSDKQVDHPLDVVEPTIARRHAEADDYYRELHPDALPEERRRVQRQALAGMLWNKQVYLFDVKRWLEGEDEDHPGANVRAGGRNVHWRHLNSMRVLSVPDKWEYPWFAAWDLAFQAVTFALVDPDFAKEQLWLLLFEQFQHPNGQIPAYEWEFSDLNPPVHAWAVWRVYNMDRLAHGAGDRPFLEKCFHKLLINFTFWVNKVDSLGNNIFEGGFLGLDNVTVFDRSQPLDSQIRLEQSDATGWMGMFCLNLMRIALELAKENAAYEALATKFFQHYVYVGAAMKNMGGRHYQLWDEEDHFFYDVLRYPDGRFEKFRVRSLVGIVPLFAVERLEEDWLSAFPEFRSHLHWFLKNRPDLTSQCVATVERDGQTVHVLTIVNREQICRMLERVWDPEEFRSPFGIRSLSKWHERHPFDFNGRRVGYEPAEASERIKGGNSNWRGPIWLPTNFMLLESLRKLGKAYGSSLLIPDKCTGGTVTPTDIARSLAESLTTLFLPSQAGNIPSHGGNPLFRSDPYWKDMLLFYEYFHPETGMGLGASHQTGWTGLVANLIDEW